MIEWFNIAFDQAQNWIFQAIVQPLAFRMGMMAYEEFAYDAVAWFLYGVLQIALLVGLVRPLESLMPVGEWPDRGGTRLDVLYTVLNKSGLLPLAFFLSLRPLIAPLDGWLRFHGLILPNLEDLIPWLAVSPFVSFLLYLIIIDAADYVRHRLQHRFTWWWHLHALHHSQRMMSFWTDDRNHLLDGAIGWVWFAVVALLIGVPPGQFVLLVTVGRLVEGFSHANVRVDFGKWGERLLVSPRFHRLHHAMGTGHEGRYFGCNFGVLFPWWDILCGTANFSPEFPATGIRDQQSGVSYGETFWEQQWLGLRRSLRAIAGR